MSTSFAARTREHMFTSGRSAVVKESISYTWLMTRIVQQEPELQVFLESLMQDGRARDADGNAPGPLQAVQLQNLMVIETWVRPRIYIPGEPGPAGEEYGNLTVVEHDAPVYGVDWCWLDDLTDDELAESIDLAFEGVRQIQRFPGDAAVDERDVGRDAVEGDAVKPAKPRKGKH